MLCYAVLYCSAVMQLCFITYNSIVLFYYVGVQHYNVVVCLFLLVCHVLMLFCTNMVFLTTMTLWYSVAQSFYTNASQSSYLPTFTTDTIHTVIWYNVDDPKRFLHS